MPVAGCKVIEQFLRGLKVRNQSLGPWPIRRGLSDLVKLASKSFEPGTTIYRSAFGELQLLQIVT